MKIELTPEETKLYLVIMAGGGNRAFYDLYKSSDEGTRERIVAAMGE